MTTRRNFNLALAAIAAGAPLAACTTTTPAPRIGAIDCHAHVFRRDLPMPDRRRAPSGYDATPEDYLAMLDGNGISHGVLVQPSFLGTDNSYMVEALRKYPARLRGIAVVAPSISPAELDRLGSAGVVGIRLNLVGLPMPDLSSAHWQALLVELGRRGWQVELHRAARDLPALIDPLLAAGLNVVVDHFGRPDDQLGIQDPGFRYLLSLGPTRRVWVKLSGAYRNGARGAGQATALAATPLLKAAFGLDRLMWGSDWPHTLFEQSENFQTERKLLDLWLPDGKDRAQVLGASPAPLFGFAPRA